MVITRKQREALKAVYDRCPLYEDPFGTSVSSRPGHPPHHIQEPITYLEFRRRVQPTFGMDGAITVPWCGMWLAIETDGYTHS